MNSKTKSIQFVTQSEASLAYRPRLSGLYQKTVLALWLLITIISGISWALSIYSLNLWDRVPAAELSRYFPEVTPDDVQALADWKNTVLQAGLSLSGYALIFTTARLIAGLSLFLVSFLLIRLYSDHLMAVLMGTLLSLFAAAGIWGNPLFAWAVAITPWMNIPAQLLGWLLWCGAIVIYTFPDGKFTPRSTVWLAMLLIPITFLIAFRVDTFLNPDYWPVPFYLLPDIVFIGGALFAVLYRYMRTTDSAQKQALRWYTTGLSLLVIIYFINLSITDIYYFLAGHALFSGNAATLKYILVVEPIWFACETFFAVGLALSIFRDKLLRN